ncbi:hypothetical protein BH09MYX1_BH09MYX1_11730 [soil metagenome]
MTAAKPANVVVTGASSGIGRALALAFAARGDRVVLSARNADDLAKVALEVQSQGGTAVVVPSDVTKEEDRVRLIDVATADGRELDVLVNNAGRGYYGHLMKVDVGELETLFALNVFAPLRLTQLARAPLARARGVVVMMSSIAGVVAAPKLGAYAASKFALEALSTSLRAEVAEDGIRVCVIRPGPVDTPFRANSVVTEVEAGVRPKGAKIQTAEDIARLTLSAIDRNRDVMETSAFVMFSSFAARVTPPLLRFALRRMAKDD